MKVIFMKVEKIDFENFEIIEGKKIINPPMGCKKTHEQSILVKMMSKDRKTEFHCVINEAVWEMMKSGKQLP